MRNGS